jgi:hypothetical protein
MAWPHSFGHKGRPMVNSFDYLDMLLSFRLCSTVTF